MTLQEMIDEEKRAGYEEGLAEGERTRIEKGRAEGEKQKQIDIARVLKLRNGMSLGEISEITGLTLAEVQAL